MGKKLLLPGLDILLSVLMPRLIERRFESYLGETEDLIESLRRRGL